MLENENYLQKIYTINIIMKTKNKGNWNSISCISYRIFATKSCVTHEKSVRVLCARRECKEKLCFLLVTPRQIYSKFLVLRWNYSSLTLYLSVLKRFKLKLLYRRLKYKRSKTDLNCLQLLCNLLTSLSASNVMRKAGERAFGCPVHSMFFFCRTSYYANFPSHLRRFPWTIWAFLW